MKSAKSASAAQTTPSAKRRSGDRRRATRKPWRKSPHPASENAHPLKHASDLVAELTPRWPVRRDKLAPRHTSRPSFFRNPGFAQTLQNVLALLEVGRVVALRHAEKSGDRVIRRKRPPSLNFGLRLLETAEIRERGGHVEMVQRIIPTGVDRAAKERDRFLVGSEVESGEASDMGPDEGDRVIRR